MIKGKTLHFVDPQTRECGEDVQEWGSPPITMVSISQQAGMYLGQGDYVLSYCCVHKYKAS